MNLDFLTPRAVGSGGTQAPVARSPMESSARAAGARFEIRDGWNIATAYAGAEQERRAAETSAGWADVSHLGKLEIQAAAATLESIAATCDASAELGEAIRCGDAWWCRLSPTRVLVLGELDGVRQRLESAVEAAGQATLAEVTSAFAAMILAGPSAREVFARFCALDLRPARTPVRALRPGSIGRQPGLLIREAEDRYLFLFGWATGEYMWSIVEDAGRHLGGMPIGADALAALAGPGADRSGESVGA